MFPFQVSYTHNRTSSARIVPYPNIFCKTNLTIIPSYLDPSLNTHHNPPLCKHTLCNYLFSLFRFDGILLPYSSLTLITPRGKKEGRLSIDVLRLLRLYKVPCFFFFFFFWRIRVS